MGVVPAGAGICFGVAYDGLGRDTVDHGANVLLVQTNNATFGFTDESVQQLAISRIRAIEHGRSVVHVPTVGVSAVIPPDGTAHQRSALSTAAGLVADHPLHTDHNVPARGAQWPQAPGGRGAPTQCAPRAASTACRRGGPWARRAACR